ncbi:hypothetical protein EDB81DRAFT_786871 [Dactylonectria macrodidyma]|uniref:Uncharacterized protein n=1 Tax=Dactylonectria macrodidyma TaxID=307937 RepID=A0A9P9FAQ2_9HYPO|nr:hypothetical protein EDB81DRAFT_786871 [Dactylonectria macrodidyma]
MLFDLMLVGSSCAALPGSAVLALVPSLIDIRANHSMEPGNGGSFQQPRDCRYGQLANHRAQSPPLSVGSLLPTVFGIPAQVAQFASGFCMARLGLPL